jgi:hypothetical protein
MQFLSNNNTYSITVKLTSLLTGQYFHLTNIYGVTALADKAGFISWLYNFDTSEIEDWLLMGDINLIRFPKNRNKAGATPMR